MTIEQLLAWVGVPASVGAIFSAGKLWEKVATLEDDVKEVKADVKDIRKHLMGD